mmetsp:Transcript_33320/g.53748  ORF Transcript_33320/g.53748 Transcript_33320/m.53748 type:complete len:90 (-) Transcript_33320:767-1036(-)
MYMQHELAKTSCSDPQSKISWHFSNCYDFMRQLEQRAYFHSGWLGVEHKLLYRSDKTSMQYKMKSSRKKYICDNLTPNSSIPSPSRMLQ